MAAIISWYKKGENGNGCLSPQGENRIRQYESLEPSFEGGRPRTGINPRLLDTSNILNVEQLRNTISNMTVPPSESRPRPNPSTSARPVSRSPRPVRRLGQRTEAQRSRVSDEWEIDLSPRSNIDVDLNRRSSSDIELEIAPDPPGLWRTSGESIIL